MRFLSAREVALLADAIEPRYATLVYFLAYAGVRIGEAAALKIDKLDLLRGYVTIEDTLSEVAGRLSIGPTKTGNKRRVTLPPFLRAILADYIPRYPSAGGFLFGSPGGGPLRPGNFLSRFFDKAVKKAGLEPFRVHDLRHTCAALLIGQGAHAKEIADRLGHSSPMVTMTVYAHILASLQERLTDGLEQAFRAAADTYLTPGEARGVVSLPANVAETGP